MFDAMSQLSPPQQVLFWMLVAILGLLITLVVVSTVILVSERQKVVLQGLTLEAIRDLYKAMAQVNDYAIKKLTDAHAKTEEVKNLVQEVVPLVAEVVPLVAENATGLSIPSVGTKSKESKS